ncbi:hypothetical protein J6590_012586 [Homalodisca vitripennis]|nr:hypothetical protein J6590_012586 [Homalodisca vitripennis]
MSAVFYVYREHPDIPQCLSRTELRSHAPQEASGLSWETYQKQPSPCSTVTIISLRCIRTVFGKYTYVSCSALLRLGIVGVGKT